MTRFNPDEPYEAALDKALTDERWARELAGSLKHRLAHIEKRLSHLSSAIDALLELIPEDRRRIFADRVAELQRPARASNRTAAYDAVVCLLEHAEPTREWSAPEVQKALLPELPLELGQVANILSYLARKNRIVRTKRGKYVRVQPLLAAATPGGSMIAHVSEMSAT
jgi:hypothetical protein